MNSTNIDNLLTDLDNQISSLNTLIADNQVGIEGMGEDNHIKSLEFIKKTIESYKVQINEVYTQEKARLLAKKQEEERIQRESQKASQLSYSKTTSSVKSKSSSSSKKSDSTKKKTSKKGAKK